MQKLILLSSFLFIAACSSPRFPNKEVCFVLYDIQEQKVEQVIDSERCEERFPPASTFKVPLAVMAFDAGVLKSVDDEFKWDGQKRFLEAWNRDHTAKSWMKESVVWYSQKLTPYLGKIKIEYYLKNFKYGNADMSGGIEGAWLTPGPNEGYSNSLKVSAMEQTFFLDKLWRETLKASADAQEKARSLLVSEQSEKGAILTGKTGSARVGKDQELRLGWYVGHLKSGFKEYIVVINFTDVIKSEENAFAGPEARELAKKILKKNKLW